MVTVTCNKNGCEHYGIDYNVLGTPTIVECGGCGAMLEPYDQRDDPPAPLMPNPPA